MLINILRWSVRTVLTTKNYLVKGISSAEVGKPSVEAEAASGH